MRFIQALGCFQRFFSGKAKHSVGVPLQAGQIIQLRRELCFSHGFCLDDRSAFFEDFSGYFFCFLFLFDMRIWIPAFPEADPPVVSEVSCKCAVIFRMKLLDFLSSFHKDCESRRLYPADAEQRIIFEGESSARIHPNEPVRLASALRAGIESVIIASRPDIPEAL